MSNPFFYFKFYKVNIKVDIIPHSRISIWLESDNTFLMPCEFVEVYKKDKFYLIKVILLDSNKFYSEKNMGKKFFFGPPDQIIGYGILEKIETKL